MRSVCGSRSLLCAECYGRTPRQHKLSPARAQPRHGELLIAVGDPVAAEASFPLAIGVARRQNAKLRERMAWAQFLPLGPAFRVTACQETRGFFRREETLGRRLPLTGGLPWLLRFCGGKNRLASSRTWVSTNGYLRGLGHRTDHRRHSQCAPGLARILGDARSFRAEMSWSAPPRRPRMCSGRSGYEAIAIP
jgi:hypothetical protein